MARILIAGCGYVGTALGESLANDGHQVFGIKRSKYPRLPKSIEPIYADLTTIRKTLLPDKIDYVFYMPTAAEYTESAYRHAYYDGLKNLLAQLTAVQRLIYISSTGVYGQNDGQWVDETSPTKPLNFSGKVLLAGEQLAKNSPFPSVVVRFGGIYGPGRVALLESIINNVCQLSKKPLFTNRIHRDDCVGVLRHLMTLAQPYDTYLAVDCEPVLKNNILLYFANELDQPYDESCLVDTDTDKRYRTHKRCSNRRLLDSGYEFIYPNYRAGYKDLIKRFKEDHML